MSARCRQRSPLGLVLVPVLVLGVFSPVLVAATPVTFDRYQVIIDRAPFGAVAGSRADAVMPGFAERYVLVGVVPDLATGRQRAVVLDKQANQIQLMAAGDTIDGVKVVEVDPTGEDARLVLQQGFQTATLRYPPRGAAPAAVPPGTVVAPVTNPVPAVQPVARPGVPQPTRRIPFRRE